MLRFIFTGKVVQFVALVALWLAAYKLATLLDVFRPYSSLWFLPAGITLSIFLAAPGWLKIAPFVANLLLVIPQVSDLIVDDNGGALAQALHAVRHCGIYGLVALGLIRTTSTRWLITNVKATVIFVALVIAASTTAAVSGISLHVWMGNISWQAGWNMVVQWTIGDAIAALVIPPILVPLLRAALDQKGTDWQWPQPSIWALQIGLVLVTLAVGSQATVINPDLGSLWYLTLIPPIFAGVTGGFVCAAISVFVTSLAIPLVAYLLSYGGEMLALSLLLTIGAIAALLVGAAVSDQRRALAEVIGHSQRLEATVAERTIALSTAYEFQRHLVRSLGHDLRQPMQSITLLLGGISMRPNLDREALSQAQVISTTMAKFLDGILNYARHDPGLVRPNLGVTSLTKLFSQLRAVYEPIATRREIKLMVAPSDVLVISDEVLLLQGLSNDLDNAIRLSLPGSTVSLRHELRDGQNALVVTDQISATTPLIAGEAGFGHDIVVRICAILGATRIASAGERGMLLKVTQLSSTPKAPPNTPIS